MAYYVAGKPDSASSEKTLQQADIEVIVIVAAVLIYPET
jgi:hypothetical protein